MKKLFLLTCLVLVLTACEDDETDAGSFEYEEKASFVMNPEGRNLLNIQNTNGSILITGSDTTSQVHFAVTKRVKSYRSSLNAIDHINDIQISAEKGNDALIVKTNHPVDNDLDYEIDFTIIAPIIFNYAAILGNGNIHINSVSRNLEIILGNGNALADVILLNDCSVLIETGNGTIQLIIPDITDANLTATVGNGTITKTGLQFSNLITTSNTLSGTMGNGNGNIAITLGNGTVALEGY